MAQPPDDPTRRIPPTGAHRPPPAERERVIDHGPAGPDPLMDRLDSLRTALTIVGLIAAAALGIAVWALLRAADAERGGGGGATSAEVRSLEEEVEDLRSRVENRATEGDVGEIAESQQELSSRVDELAEAVEAVDTADSGEATDQQARDALEAVEESLTDLDQRVSALEQQAQEAP